MPRGRVWSSGRLKGTSTLWRFSRVISTVDPLPKMQSAIDEDRKASPSTHPPRPRADTHADLPVHTVLSLNGMRSRFGSPKIMAPMRRLPMGKALR